jgi:hypothetical protein
MPKSYGAISLPDEQVESLSLGHPRDKDMPSLVRSPRRRASHELWCHPGRSPVALSGMVGQPRPPHGRELLSYPELRGALRPTHPH